MTYLLRRTSDSFSGGNIFAVDSAGFDSDRVDNVVGFVAIPSTRLPVAAMASLALVLPVIATK